jgi:hypothetical protein
MGYCMDPTINIFKIYKEKIQYLVAKENPHESLVASLNKYFYSAIYYTIHSLFTYSGREAPPLLPRDGGTKRISKR